MSLSSHDHNLLICAIRAVGCWVDGRAVVVGATTLEVPSRLWYILPAILLSSGCGERSTSPLGPLLTCLMHTIRVLPPQDAREFKVLREFLSAGHGTTRVIRFVGGVESLNEVRRNDDEQKVLCIMYMTRIVIYKFLA